MVGGLKIYASGKGNKSIARFRSQLLRGMSPMRIEFRGYSLRPVISGIRMIVQRNTDLRIEGALINHNIDNYLERVPKFFDSYHRHEWSLTIYDHYSFHLGIQEAVRWYVYKGRRDMIRKCHNVMVHYRKCVRIGMNVTSLQEQELEGADKERIEKLQNRVLRHRGKYWDIRKIALLKSVKAANKAVEEYKKQVKKDKNEKREEEII